MTEPDPNEPPTEDPLPPPPVVVQGQVQVPAGQPKPGIEGTEIIDPPPPPSGPPAPGNGGEPIL